jgi:hypothetical protein
VESSGEIDERRSRGPSFFAAKKERGVAGRVRGEVERPAVLRFADVGPISI